MDTYKEFFQVRIGSPPKLKQQSNFKNSTFQTRFCICYVYSCIYNQPFHHIFAKNRFLSTETLRSVRILHRLDLAHGDHLLHLLPHHLSHLPPSLPVPPSLPPFPLPPPSSPSRPRSFPPPPPPTPGPTQSQNQT